MNGFYEDIDEDLDELDDESDDSGFAERRRRRQQPRGGRYTQPRTGNGQVGQNQLNAALLKVGDDVKKLNANQVAQERQASAEIRKLRQEYQNFAQVSLLMPLLTSQKTVNVTAAGGGTVEVLAKSDSSLTTLLPLMLLMPQNANSGSQSGSGNMMNNPMMMILLLKLLEEGKTS